MLLKISMKARLASWLLFCHDIRHRTISGDEEDGPVLKTTREVHRRMIKNVFYIPK